MPSFADLRAYGRFTTGLRSFLRLRITPEAAAAIVRERLADRAGMLLRLAERGIYGHPASPYRELLRLAGCELGDLRRLVADRGVEGALGELRRVGVYVSFEEFKGRRPIVRGGREIAVGDHAFDNPFSARYYHGSSSGSTGPGTRIALDLDHMRASMPHSIVAEDANRVLGVASAVWRTILPGLAGVSTVLRSATSGRVVERWFSPVATAEVRPSLKNRLATGVILTAGRLAGVPLPRPEPVPLERAEIVARWVRAALDREGACMLRGHVSCLLRVAVAAREAGIDLTGATLWGGGEPPTPGKVGPMLATGARYVPTYYLSEAGAVGLACANPADPTDVHVMADSLAVIEHPVRVPGTELEVDALHFTTLLATSPKILFNVESDDFGVLEERSCGCPMERVGFARHVRRVKSYRKLTVEGMSLVGSDMVRILEEVLPARFGGTPLDYQLVLEESEEGLTRLVLLVHPGVAIADGEAVIAAVLEELGRGDDASELARAVWRQAGTLTLRRRPPRFSNQGKFMPLITMGGVVRPAADARGAGGRA